MKKFLACSLIAMLACGALLAGCGGDKKDEAAAGKTKAAFVYVSSAKDGGYSMVCRHIWSAWKWIWQGDYHRFSWWGRWGVR